MSRKIFRSFLGAVLVVVAASADAGVGMMDLPANAVSGPVTVFYPTQAAPGTVRRGAFQFDAAVDAAPSATSFRLVVISHGSPGTPWGHLDLARALVEAGFTVALPEHQADNAKDPSDPGPPAWRRRPLEVSRAIDRLAQEPTFASRLDFTRVGMFGMSAGGHTALTLAGGRWSPSRLREHCRVNITEDFHACAGPSVSLDGDMLDGVKKWMVSAINDRKFDDAAWYEHVDGRIVAVAAGVPFAADFDPDSLRQPKVALALISGQKLFGFSDFAWLMLAGLALGPQLLGHSAVNWALKHLSASFIAVAILGEPVGSAILAWVFLGEKFAVLQLCGFAALLVGIYLAAKAEDRKQTSNGAP